MEVKLHPQARVVRHVPPKTVAIQGESLPLIDPKDPDHKQIQEVLTAHVKVFNLAKPEDLAEYQAVWQTVTDQKAAVSECVTNWHPESASYIVYLRWVSMSLVAPQA